MIGTEIWLYGSVARGQYESSSDLDILIVGDPIEDRSFLDNIVSRLPQSRHVSLRHYDWKSIAVMAEYGSLFLVHLQMEGRLLAQFGGKPGLLPLLRDLPRYSLVDRDITGFKLALRDVSDSLDDGGDLGFELSVIATVIRHSSILACYLLKDPQFDRKISIPLAFDRLNMAWLAAEALELYSYRLTRVRKIPAVLPAQMIVARRWCHHATEFVARVGEIRD